MAVSHGNVAFLDINKYIKGQESFYDQFNHFVQEVYYEMARELVELVAERKQISLNKRSKTFMRVETLKEDLRLIKNKLLRKKRPGG